MHKFLTIFKSNSLQTVSIEIICGDFNTDKYSNFDQKNCMSSKIFREMQDATAEISHGSTFVIENNRDPEVSTPSSLKKTLEVNLMIRITYMLSKLLFFDILFHIIGKNLLKIINMKMFQKYNSGSKSEICFIFWQRNLEKNHRIESKWKSFIRLYFVSVRKSNESRDPHAHYLGFYDWPRANFRPV